MVSNDTRLLEPGRGLYATLLEPKGHMLGDMTLFAFDDSYLADTEPGMASALSRILNRYLIREKAVIEVVGPVIVGVSGPQSGATLRSLFPDFPELGPPFGCGTVDWDGTRIRVFRKDFTGEESYLLGTAPDRGIRLWKTLEEAGVVPFGQETLEVLRVEAGIPRYGADTSEEIIPLEAGLFFGISRDKGCYTGQEIVERISSRGHTNRRLLPLKIAPGPTPSKGDTLHFEGKEVGRITSVVFSPGLSAPLALGYARHAASAPGTRLHVTTSEGETAAEALAQPIYGSGKPPAITSAEPTW
jgi:folate-binding protein YgfZ